MKQVALCPDGEGRRATPLPHTGRRFATGAPSTYDAQAHTVEVILSVGAAVNRGFFVETLAITPDAIDLSRVASGKVKLLDSHNPFDINAILGTVRTAGIENGQLVGLIEFDQGPGGQAAEAMVARGTLNSISIGYSVGAWAIEGDPAADVQTWRATSWTLQEASFVSVPADPSAGTRSAAQPPAEPAYHARKDAQMSKSETAGAETPEKTKETDDQPVKLKTTEKETVKETLTELGKDGEKRMAPNHTWGGAEALDFMEIGRALGCETEARGYIDAGISPDQASKAVMRAAADKQRASMPPLPAKSAAHVTNDERATRRSAMESAILNRINSKNELSDAGREYRGMTIIDMVRADLEHAGKRTKGLDRNEVFDLAFRTHSTSDFPNILGAVSNKSLRDGYQSSPQTFKAWMRSITLPDYKSYTRLQLGDAPSLLLVPEGGEYKQGSIGEGTQTIKLAKYGRLFKITREAIINDDLDAFSSVPASFGQAAADLESDIAYTPLIANPNMSDGNALFSSAHGNLAGSGAAISSATVQAIQIAMSAMTNMAGRPMSIMPKFLIVSPKDWLAAQQLIASITANQTTQVNVWSNMFSVVVEQRLARASGATPWFMAADPGRISTIEYAYLRGEEGPVLSEYEGFVSDDLTYKVRHSFAAAPIDSKGLYENPGT